MTIPFWCLVVAILIPYVLAGVGGYYKTRQFDQLDNHEPRTQALHLEAAGARTWAAQSNAWEALTVFAPAVIVAHLAGADAELSAVASVLFVVGRGLHSYFYIIDRPPFRSAAFTVGLLCSLWLFGLAAVA